MRKKAADARDTAAGEGAGTAPAVAGLTLEHHLGGVVRRVRLAQRLTIAEVARKAGISSGMLSKLENGQSSASLDTLVNLSRALGVSMSTLFQGYPPEEGGAQLVKKGRGMEVVRRGTKRGHTYHLLYADRGPRRVFEPFLVTLTDESEVFQRFEHPGTEFLHVLEGRIEPGRVFDRTTGLDDVPDGYLAMQERRALKVMVAP